MKRIQLQPWTTYEKLCLASAVQRTGDQNWTAVSRAAKNIFEETTKTCTVDRRPPEWFSMKQCAAQYEFLLKNVVGPRRKKRTEKGPDITDTPAEIIMNALRQDYIEELNQILSEEQIMYLKVKKENEDIDAGLLDDKLEDMLAKIEAKEREKDIRIKLKFKLGEKHLENDVPSNKSMDLDSSLSQPEAEVKPSSATSPLLTSLLQSPSPLTRPPVPSSISLLLNSTPAASSNESPTLSKLLESPTPLSAPTPQTPEPLPAVAVDQLQKSATPVKTEIKKEAAENEVKAPEEEKADKLSPQENAIDDIVHGVVESEVVIEPETPEEKKKSVARRLDLELEDLETEEEVIETVEQIIEKVEEAIIETVGETAENDLGDMGLNQTLESENIEDHLGPLDLDHEAVELIVVGPNQGPVIAVRHNETLSDQNDSSKLLKDSKEGDTFASTLNDMSSLIEEESKVSGLDVGKAKSQEGKESVIGGSRLKLEELEKEAAEEDEVHSEVVVEEVIDESKSDSDTFSEWIKGDLDGEGKEKAREEVIAEVIGRPGLVMRPFVGKTEVGGRVSSALLEATRKAADEGPNQAEEQKTKKQPAAVESIPLGSPAGSSRWKTGSPIRGKEEKPSRQEEKPPTPQSEKLSHPKDESFIAEKESESERKKGGRKRTSLATQFDSKPNSPASSFTDEDKDYRTWKKSILLVYSRLAAHKYASVFLKPITEAEAIGYHSIIKRPMDLTTIKRNIESGLIRTTVEFQRDMLLMVQNAIMYNKSNTLVFKMAHDMLNDMLAQMEIMVQAIGDGVPLRRDSYEGLPTRGRASKQVVEESSKRKRSSIGDDSKANSKRKKTDT